MSVSCGAHEENTFDHTCDDCMLPPNHLDDPRINDLNTEPMEFEEVPF